MHPKLKLTLSPEEIESAAWDQIKNCLDIPYLEKLVIMPDVHCGYDLPIGGIALLKDYIWPGAVGFDIGCGMCHINTGLTKEKLGLVSPFDRVQFFEELQKTIPAGIGSSSTGDYIYTEFPNASGSKELKQIVDAKGRKQLGTLGSGNHFLEIGISSTHTVGITIHSGSRKPGHSIGGHYMKLAKKEKHAMFPINSELGQAYYTDMLWAEKYAYGNREIMMARTLKLLGLNFVDYVDSMINESHNHAQFYWGEENTLLHRKGATPAHTNQMGIIPGNQKDGTWITRGLGNEEFLCSASHGVGRCKSRTRAKKELDFDTFRTQMEGIVCKADNLEEAPGAYKDPLKVVLAQSKLVKMVDHFTPIIVLKG